MSSVPKRHYVIGGLLAVTIAAALWASQLGQGDEAAAVAGATRRAPTAAPKPADKSELPARQASSLSAVPRAPWPDARVEQFGAWMPPPPPPPPSALPAALPPLAPQAPAPVAPPLPYELIGRLVEDGQPKALLSGPLRTLAVQAGELIDEQWQVDAINERGLSLTYKPTGIRRTLAFRMTP
ncbi:MAG: hypothetical protein JO006_05005 [Paucibacter sp.]|nr:hypothetical protein [Roseateles sp.]